jgi:TolB-like protein/Tfp pilus assembly protein PilF
MKYAFADYVLDPASREVRFRGVSLPAEPQVFDLVLHLLRHRDRVVPTDELVEIVWSGRIVSDSTIRNRINGARRLVGDDGQQQAVIRTVPRRGLRFVADVVEEGREHGEAGRPDTRRRPVVAVLPFIDLGTPEPAHLADGITEDIITLLARYRSLAVVARNSIFAFRGQSGDVRRVGAELGAEYVVEGSVRRHGGHLRVTAHLIESATGRLLWADRFDRCEMDLFELQDDIASLIAASLEPQIGIMERARARRQRPANLHAWELLHLGTGHMYRATRTDNAEAQRHLRQAIAADGTLAQAYAHLAYAILLSMLYFEADPDEERLAEAHDLARRAVDLDPDDAMARFVFGRVLVARRDYTAALQELELSVSLNPAPAIGHCGVGDSLSYDGRYEEAFPHFRRAIDLSPHDPQRWAFHAYRALAHLLAGQYEQAVDWAGRAARIPNCHYWPYVHRVAALGYMDDAEKLHEAVQALDNMRPGFTCRMARHRLFYLKDARQLDLYVDGLRRAGLPEE